MPTRYGHVFDTLRQVFTGSAAEPPAMNDTIRSFVAGAGATGAIASSVTLFEAGGKLVLDESTRSMVRAAAEKSAEGALLFAGGPLLGPFTLLAKRQLTFVGQAGNAARTALPAAAKVASREILKGAGRAASIGFLIDGAFAGVEAVAAVKSGVLDRKSAAGYVMKEATTGAIATGAGVLAGAGLVALTGGAAAPLVFAVGALGSVGTKRLLRRLSRPSRELAVRRLDAPRTAP